MALAVVQHASTHGSGSGSPPGSVTLGGSPTVGNWLIAFVQVNISFASLTFANGWTPFGIAIEDTGGSCIEVGLRRLVQVGDTTALPAFCSAGNTFWAATVQEISGGTGTWTTDCHSVSTYSNSSNASSVSNFDCITQVANTLSLIGWAQYNGSSNVSAITGWTLDENQNNSSNYGAYGCAHQAVTSSGTVLQPTVTFGGSSGPIGVIQLVMTTSSPTLPTVRQSVYAHGSSAPGSINLDMDPIVGNTLVAFLSWGNGGSTSPTVSASWSDVADAVNGSNKQLLALMRGVVGGDTKATPATVSSGSAFWALEIHEVYGNLAVNDSKVGRQASGSTMTSTAVTAAANNLVLLHFSNYDGNTNLSIGSPWWTPQRGFNFGDYGSWITGAQFSSGGGSLSGTCTMSSSGNPQAYVALALGVATATKVELSQGGAEVWGSYSATFQFTQAGGEVWILPAPPLAEFTQVGLELWRTTDSGATLATWTQTGAEVWLNATFAYYTQAGAEVWETTSPKAQISQVGLEVWDNYSPISEFTQIGAEVWISLAVGSAIQPFLFTVT